MSRPFDSWATEEDRAADVRHIGLLLAQADRLEQSGSVGEAWLSYAEALSRAGPYAALPTDSVVVRHAIDFVVAKWHLRPDSLRLSLESGAGCPPGIERLSCEANLAADSSAVRIPATIAVTQTFEGITESGGRTTRWYWVWTPAFLDSLRTRHERRQYGRDARLFTRAERDWGDRYLIGRPVGPGRPQE